MGIELVDDDDEEPAPVDAEVVLEEDPGADNKRKAEEDLANSPNKQPKLATTDE